MICTPPSWPLTVDQLATNKTIIADKSGTDLDRAERAEISLCPYSLTNYLKIKHGEHNSLYLHGLLYIIVFLCVKLLYSLPQVLWNTYRWLFLLRVKHLYLCIHKNDWINGQFFQNAINLAIWKFLTVWNQLESKSI